MSKDSLQGHQPASAGSPLRTMLSCLLVAFAVTLLSLLPPGEANSDESWPQFGPVSAEQTLWSLARDQRPDPAITIHQYMLALVDANPGAFVADNVNLMRQGVVLALPDAAFAQRISPGEASRRVDEQMQWYASLSREELRALRLEGRMPAPRAEAPEPQVEDDPPHAEIVAAEPADADPAVAEAAEPEPTEVLAIELDRTAADEVEHDVSAPALVDHELPVEEAAAAADVFIEETEESLVDGFPLEPLTEAEADSVAPEVWVDDPTVADLAESEVMPAGQMPEGGLAEEALEVETVVPAEEPVAPAAAPAPIQPAAPAEPARSLVPLLSLGLVLVLLLLALIWFLRRRSKAVANDATPMPTARSKPASAAMSAAPVAGSTVEREPEAELDERSEAATREDDWGSLEAAVIAAGPVPKIDSEFVGDEADSEGQGEPESPASVDAAEPGPESDPQQRLAELDELAGESTPEPAIEETDPLGEEKSTDAADASDSDDFVLEDLGWFEDDDDASSEDDSDKDQPDLDLAALSQRPEAEEATPVPSADADELGAEVDLSELTGKPETVEGDARPADEPGLSAESEFDGDLELDLDLNSEPDLSDSAAPNPEASDWDFLSEAEPGPAPDTEPDSVSEAVREAEPEPEDESEPEPEPEPGLELEPAAEPETLPESEPESAADSAAELDDASAEVMLDLARLSAEAGDEDYAREVLEELIAKSSSEMAARARELRDSLGG